MASAYLDGRRSRRRPGLHGLPPAARKITLRVPLTLALLLLLVFPQNISGFVFPSPGKRLHASFFPSSSSFLGGAPGLFTLNATPPPSSDPKRPSPSFSSSSSPSSSPSYQDLN